MRPFISVVMPVFNGENYIAEALQSLASQPGSDSLHLIAVDDGSTDGTVGILEAWSSRLSVEIVRRPHLGNWVSQTNHGLGLANGEYVCFLHHDDAWMPGRLSVIRDAVAAHPEADMFIGPIEFVDLKGGRLGRCSCPLPAGRLLQPADWFPPLLVQNFVPMHVPVVRRELMASAAFDESLRFATDWKFWLGLASRATSVVLPVPTVQFRVHGASQTIDCARDLPNYRDQLESVLREMLPLLEKLTPEPERWADVARYSVEVNVMLAALADGNRALLPSVVWQGVRLGIPAVWRYLHYSRVIERSLARVRAGLGRRG
jgi:glycosyltransferase involved in cell wall biosynthesis